jgi:hypothetical protein
MYWRFVKERLGSLPVREESARSAPAVLARTVDPDGAIQLALQSRVLGFTPETTTYAVWPAPKRVFGVLSPESANTVARAT